MSSDLTVEVVVQTAPYPQDVTCPACAETFRELIKTEKINGVYCPRCDAHIRLVHRRDPEPRDDTTEQTTLTFESEPRSGGEP